MIKIHDIKPIVEIPDFSIYIYYTLLTIFGLFILLMLIFLYKFFKPKPKTLEYQYYQKLKILDFSNSKESAYLITKYGYIIAKDERQIRLLEELNESLELYKYKKNIDTEFSNEVKTKFDLFMDSIDVR